MLPLILCKKVMHINKTPNRGQTNFLNCKWQILLIGTPEENYSTVPQRSAEVALIYW